MPYKELHITSMSFLLAGVGYCNAMLGTFPQKKKERTRSTYADIQTCPNTDQITG